MPNYRRLLVAGRSYFFTVNLRARQSDLLVRRFGDLKDAIGVVRGARPFHVDAWVVLPDHMHWLWTLPSDDADYAGRWREIKKRFSKKVPAEEMRTTTMRARAERGVWQRRYWEHMIRDDADYAAHVDYIHFNPVRHGLVAAPGDWAFSSFRRCVGEGIYPREWMGAAGLELDCGER